MVRWESTATQTAGDGLRDQGQVLAGAAGVVAAAGRTPPGTSGHAHVSAGLSEFAAYWEPFLVTTAQAADVLAQHVVGAGEAFAALDASLAGAAAPPVPSGPGAPPVAGTPG